MDPTVIIIAEWGLLPSWAKDKKLQNNSLNARIESLKKSLCFRIALTIDVLYRRARF
jgi:putative SOS response-associated peptidase YedK